MREYHKQPNNHNRFWESNLSILHPIEFIVNLEIRRGLLTNSNQLLFAVRRNNWHLL